MLAVEDFLKEIRRETAERTYSADVQQAYRGKRHSGKYHSSIYKGFTQFTSLRSLQGRGEQP